MAGEYEHISYLTTLRATLLPYYLTTLLPYHLLPHYLTTLLPYHLTTLPPYYLTGEYELHISMEHAPISGSPFRCYVASGFARPPNELTLTLTLT